jgi:anti-anti-sigma regulatory factor
VELERVTLPPVLGGGAAVTVLHVRGDIDITNIAAFELALAEPASGGLIVDLGRAGQVSSAGFALLHRRARQGNAAIVVASDGIVHAAATLVNLPFHESVAAARDWLVAS